MSTKHSKTIPPDASHVDTSQSMLPKKNYRFHTTYLCRLISSNHFAHLTRSYGLPLYQSQDFLVYFHETTRLVSKVAYVLPLPNDFFASSEKALALYLTDFIVGSQHRTWISSVRIVEVYSIRKVDKCRFV